MLRRKPGRRAPAWVLALGLLTCPAVAAPIVDLDASGFGDVWEQRYGAAGLAPGGDNDDDRWTNAEEHEAGTNPLDPDSTIGEARVRVAGADVIVAWDSQPGKRYTIFASDTPGAPVWPPVGVPIIAVAAETEVTLPGEAGGPRRFFRIGVGDVDSDGDGVPDWDERQVEGFDPNAPQSAVPGQADLVSLTARLQATTDTVTLTAPTPDAFEKEVLAGKFQIARTGSLKAIQAPIALSGNPNVQGGSASAADYVFETSGGAITSVEVDIPFGASVVDVLVRPVLDSLIEVPETLAITLSASAAYQLGGATSGAVVIHDAQNTSANRRLFVAYLTPQDGVVSSASGLSTVLLNGDNTIGLVDLSFSGLTSPQFQAHIHVPSTPGGTGPAVATLPKGQFADFSWPVNAAQFLTTDQATLDALFSGQLYANVHSTIYTEGEIRGDYALTDGAIEPPLPGDPPPIAPLAGEELSREVARFLTQASFGPTKGEIEALVEDIDKKYGDDRIAAFSAWIDDQLNYDQTNLLDYLLAADGQEWALRGTTPLTYSGGNEPGHYNRRRAWWMAAVRARDQLRQRAGFALNEIFVISENETNVRTRHYGAAKYCDMLGAHADGNFRSLIEEVSKSPMMGTYLSHLKNQKAVVDPLTGETLISPDENYAREVMQLFSIGLVLLRLDGGLAINQAGKPTATYTNYDITELARVLTGWSFSKAHGTQAQGYPVIDNTQFNRSAGPAYFQASWLNPMINFAAYHDTAAKTVLGQPIAAGLDGGQDLDAALDILFNHQNTAPFICRRLIQRMVTSTPSAGYIHRVARKFEDDGTGVRGNLKAVIKAILLDHDARTLAVAGTTGYGKQKEPIIRYIQFIRALSGASQLPLSDLSAYGFPAGQLDNFPVGATCYRYSDTESALSQIPLRSPTVFNWFLPDYSPGGSIAAAGLFAPEMQITTETQVVETVNYNRSLIYNSTGQSVGSLFGATDPNLDNIRIDLTPWDAIYNAAIAAGQTPVQAVTAVLDSLDLVLSAGNLKAKYASAPAPNPRASIISAASLSSSADRVKALIYLLTASPEFIHQK